MKRVYNFAAGPSMLPLEVLESAKKDLLDYKGTGMSVMEMSHRSNVFKSIIEEAEKDLRDLMHIPENYQVLFMQGGASLQFGCIPLNLMNGKPADYIISGNFSNKAYEEAKKFGDARILATSIDKNFTYIPYVTKFKQDASYVHICFNNTIYGSEYYYIPETLDVPLVADISSCILSKNIDVTKFGVLYAGAQKNIGPAGLTIVIVRRDLLDKEDNKTPVMMNWGIQAKHNSLYNTPPCYSIYMAGLVFKWLKSLGGVEYIEKVNDEKAKLLYDFIDSSTLYKNHVEKKSRSNMNVCFTTGSSELDNKFCEEAKKYNIENIKGHKLVGGMRASIYNAMPIEGVRALIEFMKKFENENV